MIRDRTAGFIVSAISNSAILKDFHPIRFKSSEPQNLLHCNYWRLSPYTESNCSLRYRLDNGKLGTVRLPCECVRFAIISLKGVEVTKNFIDMKQGGSMSFDRK